MLGWTSSWFTEGRVLSPANDQTLFTRAPTTHGPVVRTPATVGPIPHLPPPRTSADAVGNRMIGPNPQMNVSECGGDRNSDRSVSPRPNVLPRPGSISGWLITARMVRVTRFQSPGRGNGITGWMLSVYCVSWPGPDPKLKLCCIGTLGTIGKGLFA